MPDHIQITPAPGRYRICLGDVLIGETDQVMHLTEGGRGPVVYVPRNDMRMGLLTATTRHTSCPWKGEANYFSVGAAENVVWSYETPKAGCEGIAGHLAFYPAVSVEKV
jgi:uncharacterized protein (DUF427 family)